MAQLLVAAVIPLVLVLVEPSPPPVPADAAVAVLPESEAGLAESAYPPALLSVPPSADLEQVRAELFVVLLPLSVR